MSVNALSLANGADLFQILTQTQGAAPVAAKTDASTAELKTAKNEAQLNAASVLDSGSPTTSPNVLNVYLNGQTALTDTSTASSSCWPAELC